MLVNFVKIKGLIIFLKLLINNLSINSVELRRNYLAIIFIYLDFQITFLLIIHKWPLGTAIDIIKFLSTASSGNKTAIIIGFCHKVIMCRNFINLNSLGLLVFNFRIHLNY